MPPLIVGAKAYRFLPRLPKFRAGVVAASGELRDADGQREQDGQEGCGSSWVHGVSSIGHRNPAWMGVPLADGSRFPRFAL